MLSYEYILPETKTDFLDDLDSAILSFSKLNIEVPVKKKKEQSQLKCSLIKKRLDVTTAYDDDAVFDELYKKTQPPPEKTVIPSLTDEEKARVTKVLHPGQFGIVSQHKNATVEFKDIYKLYPETWLNDEIINFYMVLLGDRAESNQALPRIHCFNTFFCSTLREQGYQKVRRWTKKVDVFTKELLLIPINRSYHWVLGVIDISNKRICIYDSMSGSHPKTLQTFWDYLEFEHRDKKQTPFDYTGWEIESPKAIPQQENMSDCGVFTCTFAERLARGCKFDFSQQDMTLLRQRMVLNILNKSL
ncbi:cysteine proteinase [Backusella circina FSU 941]|nr:cysteine proteinase [Backusella circina FSU 941]